MQKGSDFRVPLWPVRIALNYTRLALSYKRLQLHMTSTFEKILYSDKNMTTRKVHFTDKALKRLIQQIKFITIYNAQMHS